MKKLLLLFLSGISMITSTAFAQGLYQQGFVEIRNWQSGYVQLLATFNNRYNTIEYGSPTQVIALPSPNNGPVAFYGVDSNNTRFMCTVSPDSDYYDYAHQVAMNLHSGSILSVSRPSGSNECSYVGLVNSSTFLD